MDGKVLESLFPPDLTSKAICILYNIMSNRVQMQTGLVMDTVLLFNAIVDV